MSALDTIYGGKKLRETCFKCSAPADWKVEQLKTYDSQAMVARCACGNVMSSWVISDPEFAQTVRDLASELKERGE